MKKVIVKGPALSRSGYGEQTRFAIQALRSRPELFDIYILIIINIYLLYLMYKESKIGFLLFIPYVLWISFASYLNLFIVINN